MSWDMIYKVTTYKYIIARSAMLYAKNRLELRRAHLTFNFLLPRQTWNPCRQEAKKTYKTKPAPRNRSINSLKIHDLVGSYLCMALRVRCWRWTRAVEGIGDIGQCGWTGIADRWRAATQEIVSRIRMVSQCVVIGQLRILCRVSGIEADTV